MARGRDRIVQAEGFNLNDLDEKIATLREEQGAFEYKLSTCITETCSV
jgi:hypothetical protein